jgi:hypothetical protein
VLALIWAIHPIQVGRGAINTGSGGSLAHAATSQPTAAASGTLQSSGIWIAQLASIRLTAGSAQLQQALDEVRIEIPGAQYLDSSNFASLNPGYWVIGCSTLKWPHCSTLIWPHPGQVAAGL